MARKNEIPADTKDRILDAAIRLFGERGYAATSLRAVTEAAQANIAAVNYHFGSKDGLLRAVVGRTMAPVNAERERLLDQLTAKGAKPGVDELVRAFVETGAHVVRRQGRRERDVARFLGRVMFETDPAVRRVFADEVDPVEGRYLAALIEALPKLPPDDVTFRYRAMVGLLALHQTGALADLAGPSADAPRLQAVQREIERLTAAVIAIFRAAA
ncbi:TetR/AcrR family transcriptional regulator [Streptomyces boninensis]|uniref:TetR/AcrR family transcriptional regulator n=1 Tax=Streptomyces boninensis TaxID=2039455 RepID=UPI003B2257BC